MDRRRIEYQLRILRVTYRSELRRQDASIMDEFRLRARSILQSLEHEVSSYPDLHAIMLEVRQELDDGDVVPDAVWDTTDADARRPTDRRPTDLTPIHVSEAQPSRIAGVLRSVAPDATKVERASTPPSPVPSDATHDV